VASQTGRAASRQIAEGASASNRARIAVIGNCQSYGVAYAMKLLDPSATVDHFSAIGKSFGTIEFFAKTLGNYDYVFSHEFPPGHLKNGASTNCARFSTG